MTELIIVRKGISSEKVSTPVTLYRVTRPGVPLAEFKACQKRTSAFYSPPTQSEMNELRNANRMLRFQQRQQQP